MVDEGAGIDQTTTRSEISDNDHPVPVTGLPVGAGLPPIHSKLVSRIEAGEFIEMSDLLCDHLGSVRSEEQRLANTKRKTVTNILEWIKCFCIYMAVVSRRNHQKIPEMLAYLTLIIEAHMEYAGDAWLGYDRRFRQRAAADLGMSWAKIDPTLWSLAFSGRAKASRCKYCFSLTHTSANCEWSTPEQGGQPPMPTTGPICFDWNKDPRPGCSRANCSYQHFCYYCAQDPSILNKFHKSVFCPYYTASKGRGGGRSQYIWGKQAQRSYKN